jgi:hypothetical protein
MEVSTSGRVGQSQVHLDLIDVPPIVTKDGRLYPVKAVIYYQFLWSTGEWYVLHVKITGFRNKALKGIVSALTITNPDRYPAWLVDPIKKNTPASMIRPEVSA